MGDIFRLRASALGKFIGKNHTLIAKGELDKMRIGWSEEFRSIMTDKGIEQEPIARAMYQDVFGRKGQFIEMFGKNVKNEFITGTPDILHGEMVVDTKIAYDRLTFSKAALSWLYIWQLKAYMWLTEKQKARLFYCMTETPDHLMARAERKLFYSGDYTTMESPEFLMAKEELYRMHDISKVPFHKRFKFWDITLDDHDITIMKKVVSKAQAYIQEENIKENKYFETNKLILLAKDAA